jgi:hypothetical protein
VKQIAADLRRGTLIGFRSAEIDVISGTFLRLRRASDFIVTMWMELP